jgi:hypothetical protein
MHVLPLSQWATEHFLHDHAMFEAYLSILTDLPIAGRGDAAAAGARQGLSRAAAMRAGSKPKRRAAAAAACLPRPNPPCQANSVRFVVDTAEEGLKHLFLHRLLV